MLIMDVLSCSHINPIQRACNTLDVIPADVCIELRGLWTLVPQQLLNVSQTSSRLQQVRREGVPIMPSVGFGRMVKLMSYQAMN